MKFIAFAIHDRAAENYGTPMFMAAKGQAIRAFDDQANNPESMMNKHPDDYTLVQLGEYDDEIALLTPLPKPIPLGKARDFIKE